MAIKFRQLSWWVSRYFCVKQCSRCTLASQHRFRSGTSIGWPFAWCHIERCVYGEWMRRKNSKNDQRLATMLQSIGRRYVIKVGAKKAIFAVLVAIIDDMSPYPAAGHLNMQIWHIWDDGNPFEGMTRCGLTVDDGAPFPVIIQFKIDKIQKFVISKCEVCVWIFQPFPAKSVSNWGWTDQLSSCWEDGRKR